MFSTKLFLEAGISTSPCASRHHISALTVQRICLSHTPTHLNPISNTTAVHYPSASLHSQTLHSGTGILTCFPSTTPFGLALGPTNPGRIQPFPGNLGFTANRDSHLLFATYASISLVLPPALLTVTSSSLLQCSSTTLK
jgi:hypothetical protein